MTAMSFASTDRKTRFSLVGSNVLGEALPTRDEWDRALDQLERWRADPSVVADEDVDAPSSVTLGLAILLARQCRRLKMPAPTRVMPNREGGVVLEWTVGSVTSTWEIDDRQQLERTRFQGANRMHRDLVDLSGLTL